MENPDLVNVQIDIKHVKITDFLKFQKNLEKLILDLSFGMGFLKIRQLEIEEFRTNLEIFEIWTEKPLKNHRFSMIFKMV